MLKLAYHCSRSIAAFNFQLYEVYHTAYRVFGVVAIRKRTLVFLFDDAKVRAKKNLSAKVAER